MHVVTVLFETTLEDAESFREAVLLQARNSLTKEVGCQRFDVCRDPEQANRFFLYEIYDDKAAFDLHLGSDHYRDFDTRTRDWVTLKQPQGWTLLGH